MKQHGTSFHSVWEWEKIQSAERIKWLKLERPPQEPSQEAQVSPAGSKKKLEKGELPECQLDAHMKLKDAKGCAKVTFPYIPKSTNIH